MTIQPLRHGASADELHAWLQLLADYVRAQPRVEILTLEVDPATLPLVLRVETQNPRGLVRLRTRNVATGAEVADTGVAGHPSTDPEQPGYVLKTLSGTSNGTAYECTLAVVGY